MDKSVFNNIIIERLYGHEPGKARILLMYDGRRTMDDLNYSAPEAREFGERGEGFRAIIMMSACCHDFFSAG